MVLRRVERRRASPVSGERVSMRCSFWLLGGFFSCFCGRSCQRAGEERDLPQAMNLWHSSGASIERRAQESNLRCRAETACRSKAARRSFPSERQPLITGLRSYVFSSVKRLDGRRRILSFLYRMFSCLSPRKRLTPGIATTGCYPIFLFVEVLHVPTRTPLLD